MHLPPTLTATPKKEPVTSTVTLSPGMTVDEAETRLIRLTLEHTREKQDQGGRDPGNQPEDAAQQAEPPQGAGIEPGGERRRRPRARRIWADGSLSVAQVVPGRDVSVTMRLSVKDQAGRRRGSPRRSRRGSAERHPSGLDRPHPSAREPLARRDGGAVRLRARLQRRHDRANKPTRPCRNDPGLRSLLLSSIAYSEHVTYAAIVDPRNVAIVHSSPTLEGQDPGDAAVAEVAARSGTARAVPGHLGDRMFEVQQPLLMRRESGGFAGTEQFGSIRVGVSTTLIRRDHLRRDWSDRCGPR